MPPSGITRLHPTRTALFLCDVQSRFASAIHQWPSVVATSAKMLKAASILSLPVYATEQAPKALGNTVSPLSELLGALPAPSTKTALPKTRFSMVLPEETDKWMKEAGNPSNVIIVGIESHVCVLQTTLDLLERGIAVHVLADGVSSCNAGERRVALERMRQAGAIVTTSESVLFQLIEDASHPNFKAISGLIKEEKEPTKTAVRDLAEHL